MDDGGRRWLFRILAAVVVPLASLVLVETGLRLAGYGHRTSFFLQTTTGGTKTLIDNAWFGLRFFPPALARSPAPVSLLADKPEGVYRVFLFGESAALGDPRPAYGVGRYLEVLLRDRFPGREIEVVCAAMTAINSHALASIARECARYGGDLWIVYAGHNEMAGPFGANTVFGPQAPPWWLVRASLAVQRLRAGQFLVRVGRGLAGRSGSPGAWGGMRMFQDRPLALDDLGRERVYRNFHRNLTELVRAGARVRVPILLSSVASNLRDCAPFASSSSPASSGVAAGSGWESFCRDGDRLAGEGRWAEAVAQFRGALDVHPRSAELHFRLGQCLLACGETDAARTHFQQARDLDTLPFRADSRMNDIIGEVARSHAGKGVLHADAEAALSRHSPAGVPGQESFYEHVHLVPEGNYRLARLWAEAIAPLLAGTATNAAASWLEPEDCARRLGLTDWNRHAALEEMLRRQLDAPFTNRFDHAARMDAIRQQLAQTRDRMKSQTPAELCSFYEEAIRRRPGDAWLHHNYAEYLKNSGDLAQAAVQMQRVRDRVPHHFAAHLQLGRLFARLRQFAEARHSLAEALRLRPDLSDADLELGQIAASQGGLEEALAHFDSAIRKRPESVGVYLRRADVLKALKRDEAAIESLRDAIRLQPSSWEARYVLGIELASSGKIAEAEAELAEVVRLQPEHVLARLNLGNLMARQERFDEALAQFREVLRLDPQNPTAKESVAALEHRPAP